MLPKTRAIRRNFCEEGFTTYLEDGKRNQVLEDAFARLETTVLDRIRKVSAANSGPELKVEVVHLFAIHLVRNPAFKASHQRIMSELEETKVGSLAVDPRLAIAFEREFGRPPQEGELLEIARERFVDLDAHPRTVLDSMANQHDLMADRLNGLHLQVVEVDPSLPGFAIGDTPIVHGDPPTDRYGFRDRLALMDANFVFGPLTRRVGVCFSHDYLPLVKVRTRRMLDTLNGLTIRAALSEVACHPDDARAVRQACQRLDRRPPSFLFKR